MENSSSLVNNVRDYLITKFEVEYKGKFDYTVEDGVYKLIWHLNNQDQPAIMQGEFTDEDHFFEYVKKEIGVRRLHQVKYFIAKYSDNKGNK